VPELVRPPPLSPRRAKNLSQPFESAEQEPTDTRHHRGAKDADGLGQGIVRIYTDTATGAIRGYSWSTVKASKYHDELSRPVRIGRLQIAG
jgi:hypothetical protein